MMKKGFTLAEVLITLAIIGIVAALTIPTLVTNYQKKQYVAGLQKSYAQIQQVLKLAMANDGVDLLENTSLTQSINGDNYFLRNTDQSAFIAELGKYLKITKVCMPLDFDNGCHAIEYKELNANPQSIEDTSNRGGDIQIFTADGMIYYFNRWRKQALFYNDCNAIKAYGGSMCSFIGIFHIDVNGEKGPNMDGRDFFNFEIDAYGKIYLLGSSAIRGEQYNWREDRGFPCKDEYGVGCAGRIFEQGWKMDY